MKQPHIVLLAVMFVIVAAGMPAQTLGTNIRQQEFELTSDVFDNTRPIRHANNP